MKIALIGYGKMGRAIAQILETDYATQHQVACRIASRTQADGLGVVAWDDLAAVGYSQLKGIDVAIEFSRPEMAFDNLSRCIEWGIPVVCGTTGWYAQLPTLRQLCEQQRGALLYAANFSVGVNILFALNRQLAQLMQRFGADYSIEIEETHHTEKLDAPSGTAISLARDIIALNPNKTAWVDAPTQHAHEIPIAAHRLPDVKGEHTVTYRSAIDTISLYHLAHTRQGFAKGAIIAAEWLVGKQGVFTMNDVLGL